MSNKMEEVFQECGAILKGHFVLTSLERHSDTYIEKIYLYQNPTVFEDLCWEIAQEVSSKPISIDMVVGPAPVGAALARSVAYHLGEIQQKKITCSFTEKDKDNQHIFRQSFHKNLVGKDILIVDDILTTGWSIGQLIKAVTFARGRTVAIAVICNRGGITSTDLYGFPLISLSKMRLETWSPENCRLCHDGIPIDAKF